MSNLSRPREYTSGPWRPPRGGPVQGAFNGRLRRVGSSRAFMGRMRNRCGAPEEGRSVLAAFAVIRVTNGWKGIRGPRPPPPVTHSHSECAGSQGLRSQLSAGRRIDGTPDVPTGEGRQIGAPGVPRSRTYRAARSLIVIELPMDHGPAPSIERDGGPAGRRDREKDQP